MQVYKFDRFKNIEFEVQSLFANISNLLYDKYCKNMWIVGVTGDIQSIENCSTCECCKRFAKLAKSR